MNALIPGGNRSCADCIRQFDGRARLGNSETTTGQRLFFAPELQIISARIEAKASHSPVLILKGQIYALYAMPDGYFQLNSLPDAEGKVFLGTWKDCIPVSSVTAPVPTPIPPPISRNSTSMCICLILE